MCFSRRRPRAWPLVVLFVFFSSSVFSDTPQCLVSFDSAKLDVCDNSITLVNEELRHLADERTYVDSNIRIVKFDAPITAAQRAALTGLGAEILGYVPYYGYKVRMDASLDSRARDIPGVNWTGPYLPIWKVSVNVSNELRNGRLLDQADNVNRLWVALHPGVAGRQTRSALASIPGVTIDVAGENFDHDFMQLGFERAQLGSIVDQLAANESVNAISFHWPNEFENSQAGWLHQSGQSDPAHLPVFEQGIFGCGQVGSALDSGLHQPNCAFEDPIFGDPVSDICDQGADCTAATPDFSHRKVGLHYMWSGTTDDPGDQHGHGTHVSGSMVGNNHAEPVDCENFTTPGGLTDLDGTAPGAQFIIQEAGGGLQYLNSLGGSLYHAASTAIETGADLHNNSWGSSCRDGDTGLCITDCQVEYRPNTRGGDAVVWENPELLLFTSSGNSGAGCGPGADVGAPGNAKNVFSIGANQRGTLGDNMASFSSRGPASDRRTKPDLTAQGQDILSAQRNACGTRPSSGTSMASPTASGLGLLVREYLQRGFYPLGLEEPGLAIANPSAALIKAVMVNGAVEIDGTGTSDDYPDENQGWGRILLDNALYFDGDDRRLWLHDGVAGLETGGQDEHVVTADAGQPLAITLVWHDFPAEEGADPHIVNLLRLEVETPDGQVWTQKLTPGGGLTDPNPFQDTTAGDYDDRNTVHQIVFESPAAGAYQVRVEGIQVAMGDAQPYALAATGNLLGVGEPDFVLQPEPSEASVCQGTDAQFDIGVFGILEFDDEVDLSIEDVPAGASGAFSVNPVTPADPAAVSVLTISGTGAVTPGEYTLLLTGEADGPGFDPITHTGDLGLRVDEALSASGLLTPADGDTNVDLQPGFTWDALAGAVEYQIQVATDAGFADIVIDEFVDEAGFTPEDELATGSDFFWRVRGDNACGEGGWSDVFEFQTRFEPVADMSPTSFAFALESDGTGNDTLQITNIGTGDLEWSIETDVLDSAVGLRSHDPALDEAFDLPEFTLESAASDPPPMVFTLDGGVLSRGDVVGFSFVGTVSGVSGSSSWASDTCMLIEAPDGTLYSVGGQSSSIEHCASANNDASWDFQGGGSTDDGTYESDHDDAFDPPLADQGEWTITFINGWASDSAADITWSDVTLTLHKQPLPVCLEEPFADVPWLSVNPDSGSTPADQTDEVTVTVDAAGLTLGLHEAYLCVTSNDQNSALVPVPVELMVTGDLAVDPDTLDFGEVEVDDSLTDSFSVVNTADAGGSDFELSGIAVSAGAPAFEVSGGSCKVGIVLAPADECTVEVAFSPGATDAFSGQVTVETVDGLTATVSLSGTGIEPEPQDPVADITPTLFDFEVSQGASDGDVLNIGNLGEAELDWSIHTAEAGAGRGDDIVVFDDINFMPVANINGGSVQWHTGSVCDCDDPPNDFNLWEDNSGLLSFFFIPRSGERGAAVSLDGETYAVLNPGDTIGPDSEFINPAPVEDATSNWLEGHDAYLGFLFHNPDTDQVNYGYVHIITTGETGYPVTVVGWAYNQAGDPITIPEEGEPGACEDPSDIPWLSADPESGTTPPAGSAPADVAVDTSDLAEGEYEALLCVTTNDPGAALVEVLVSLTVIEATEPPGNEVFLDRFEKTVE